MCTDEWLSRGGVYHIHVSVLGKNKCFLRCRIGEKLVALCPKATAAHLSCQMKSQLINWVISKRVKEVTRGFRPSTGRMQMLNWGNLPVNTRGKHFILWVNDVTQGVICGLTGPGDPYESKNRPSFGSTECLTEKINGFPLERWPNSCEKKDISSEIQKVSFYMSGFFNLDRLKACFFHISLYECITKGAKSQLSPPHHRSGPIKFNCYPN